MSATIYYPFGTSLTAGTQTINGAKTFTLGPWTFTRTHVDSSNETIATFALDEDTNSKVYIGNLNGTNATANLGLVLQSASSNRRGFIVSQCQTDSGTTPMTQWDWRVATTLALPGTGTAITTRPLLQFSNNNTSIVTLSAAGALVVSGGTAPALGVGTAVWKNGAGSPEGSVTAPIGSLYTRTDGGANTTLYVKESGVGNTGWVAK